LASVPLALVSLRGGWRLLLAVGLGMLVAVVLMSAVPVYTSLVANVQLQASINRQGPVGRNVEVVASTQIFSADLHQREDTTVLAEAGQYLRPFTRPDVTDYLTSQPITLAHLERGNTEVPSLLLRPPQVAFGAYDYAQASPHMHLLAGALPGPAELGASNLVQALATEQMVQVLGVQIGDLLAVQPPYVLGNPPNQIIARIVGIWQPRQVDDPFWNGRTFTTNPVGDRDPYIFPVLLDSQAFVAAFTRINGVLVSEHWVYYTLPQRITTSNMAAVAENIARLRTLVIVTVQSQGPFATIAVLVLTGLDMAIHDIQQQFAVLNLPLYAVLAQVIGLTLLFVGTLAGLLVEAQVAAIATLKSRGASGVQLLGSYGAQALLLAVIAVGAGPRLAVVFALSFVRWFVPAATLTQAGITIADLARQATPVSALAPAVAAALLGVGALALATQRAARLDVLAFRRDQGRTGDMPFWQRYYLDVGLFVVCALGYLELNQFGGLGVRQQLGPTTSYLALGAPGLLLVAGSLLLLRLFPLAANAGLRLSLRGRGAARMLAFAQLARGSASAPRLALLLSLAVGLGFFALTFDGSLARNVADLATYQTGADLRLAQHRPEGNGFGAALQARLARLSGVEGVTPAYRSTVSTTPTEGIVDVSLLAVDPATWPQVAGTVAWRGDYADASLVALMAGLRAHQQRPHGASPGSQFIVGNSDHPIWALVSPNLAHDLSLRVGERFELSLTDAETGPTYLVVGAIVREFPTVYPTEVVGGFAVIPLGDYEAIAAPGNDGPNEFWLKTTNDPTPRAALIRALQDMSTDLDIDHTVDRRAIEATIAGNPVQSGMRGLLTLGAALGAAMAVLGGLVQATLSARQRSVQFAVLRALGTSKRQLTNLLLGEQVVTYAFGLLAGSLVGLALASATLPFLQFSDTAADSAMLGIPPYTLAFDPAATGLFYAALLAAFLVALFILTRYAATVGLGRALRLGED
jgi:putative ABC transport system permease protein